MHKFEARDGHFRLAEVESAFGRRMRLELKVPERKARNSLLAACNNAIARRLTIPSPRGNFVESNYAASVSLREMEINSFGAGKRDRRRDGEEKLAIRVDAAMVTREQEADVVRRWDRVRILGRQACPPARLAINQERPAVIYCSVSLFSRNKAYCSQNGTGIEKSRKARLRGFEASVNR